MKRLQEDGIQGRRRRRGITTIRTVSKQIAEIPSRDTLIAKFMGSIQSPISKLRRRVFAQIAEQKQKRKSVSANIQCRLHESF